MKKLAIFILTGSAVLFSCKTERPVKTIVPNGELIFQSGFQTDTIVARGIDADIVGADKTLADHNDWVKDLDNHPEIGSFTLQYQGGDESMRYAKIIAEPGKPSNRVLQFWLNEPNVEGSKGRIQANIYGNPKGMKEFYQSVRMFLPADFAAVRKFPKKINWLTIAEFWNNITWSQTVPNRFRITLGIGKLIDGEDDLHFILDAEDCQLFPDESQKYTKVWAETNAAVKVPIGKWFTMDYYYKEGNRDNGRFFLSIKPDGEPVQTVLDVKNFTHNSTDPAPDGVTDFNPMKLYTSKELIVYMKGQGKSLEILWDDFKLWKNKKPE